MKNFIVKVEGDNIKICWGGRFGAMDVEQAKRAVLNLQRAVDEIEGKKQVNEK